MSGLYVIEAGIPGAGGWTRADHLIAGVEAEHPTRRAAERVLAIHKPVADARRLELRVTAVKPSEAEVRATTPGTNGEPVLVIPKHAGGRKAKK